MYDARNVANKLIALASSAGREITPLQAMELVYFCHAWTLALLHKPLICQDVEAWRHGPVVPEVYRSLRRYGGEAIPRPIPNLEPETFAEADEDIIRQVSEKYGALSASRLVAMTLSPGTPWDSIWKKYGRNAVIPDPIIERHYEEIARQHNGS